MSGRTGTHSTEREERSSWRGSGSAPSTGRRARRSSTGSLRRRRTANESIAADEGSSHWTSSIASVTDVSEVSARSSPRNPNATARSSGSACVPVRRSSASSSAARCGSARASDTSSRAPAARSASPANASRDSPWASAHESTRCPPARVCSTAIRHSVVFPMPASPSSTSAAGSRSTPPDVTCSIVASSTSRPTISTGACIWSVRRPYEAASSRSCLRTNNIRCTTVIQAIAASR